jgi:hypothetical protein
VWQLNRVLGEEKKRVRGVFLIAAGTIDHYAFVQRFSSPTKGEASQLLYSRNCVTLQECAILTSFFDHIGPQNASFLRHICIPFPAFDNYHFGSVALKKDSIRTLKRMRDNCTNLVALKTSLHFRMIIAMESAMDFDSPQAAAALALVEARFKAILSLKEIIANVYNKPLNCDLREKICGCGWTIEGTWEESESVGSSDGEDEYWWND